MAEDYEAFPRIPLEAVRLEWSKFYEPYGERPDYSTRLTVGWFEME